MSQIISKGYNKLTTFATSKRGKTMFSSLLLLLLMLPVTTFCVTVNENVTTQSVMGGVVDIILDVAKWVGIILGVSGVVSLILAYKDDNADGQSRAVRLVVVALVLIGLKTLLKTAGFITG